MGGGYEMSSCIDFLIIIYYYHSDSLCYSPRIPWRACFRWWHRITKATRWFVCTYQVPEVRATWAVKSIWLPSKNNTCKEDDLPLVFLHGRAKAPKAANDAVSSQHAPCFRQLSEVPAAMGLVGRGGGGYAPAPLITNRSDPPPTIFFPHPSLSIPSTLS